MFSPWATSATSEKEVYSDEKDVIKDDQEKEIDKLVNDTSKYGYIVKQFDRHDTATSSVLSSTPSSSNYLPKFADWDELHYETCVKSKSLFATPLEVQKRFQQKQQHEEHSMLLERPFSKDVVIRKRSIINHDHDSRKEEVCSYDNEITAVKAIAQKWQQNKITGGGNFRRENDNKEEKTSTVKVAASVAKSVFGTLSSLSTKLYNMAIEDGDEIDYYRDNDNHDYDDEQDDYKNYNAAAISSSLEEDNDDNNKKTLSDSNIIVKWEAQVWNVELVIKCCKALLAVIQQQQQRYNDGNHEPHTIIYVDEIQNILSHASSSMSSKDDDIDTDVCKEILVNLDVPEIHFLLDIICNVGKALQKKSQCSLSNREILVIGSNLPSYDSTKENAIEGDDTTISDVQVEIAKFEISTSKMLVEKQIESWSKQVETCICNAKRLKLLQQQKSVKGLNDNNNKTALLHEMRKRKLLQQKIDTSRGTLLNLEQALLEIESAHTNKQVLNAMKITTNTLKYIRESSTKTGDDDKNLFDIIDDLNDERNEMQQIQDSLIESTNIIDNNGVMSGDEDELLQELEQLTITDSNESVVQTSTKQKGMGSFSRVNDKKDEEINNEDNQLSSGSRQSTTGRNEMTPNAINNSDDTEKITEKESTSKRTAIFS